MVFHLPYLESFKKNGYEVHVCAKNDYENKEDCNIPNCDKYFDLPFERSPYNIKNLKVYKQLKKIIKDNNYVIIHCHTPMGGVLTRLAARKERNNGTKVIYTAHGFHFYKGASLKNWLIYYSVERFLARYTDVLITINKEDFNRAKKFNAKKVEYVPGVGLDIDKFKNIKIDKLKKRSGLGIPENAFVVLSVGELNKNKNHETVIMAIGKLNNPDIHYVICGQGPLRGYLGNLAKKLGIEKQVHLLGFREDVAEIYKISDLFVFPSFREGLPVALMEAMASGLSVVCSNIRGNADLVNDRENGYVVELNDVESFAKFIEKLYKDYNLRNKYGNKSFELVQKYSLKGVLKKMEEIYGLNVTCKY